MPGVVVFPSVTNTFLFLFCVYRCEHDKLKTFRWRPHPSVLHPLSCHVSSFVNAQRENKQGGRRRQAGGTFGVLMTA